MIRYVAYALMGLMVISGLLATKTAFAQEWYAGEGVQQGLLVKYSISHLDYKAGQPFEATLWFGSQDDKGNWITDVIVKERGNIACGKFTLSPLNLTPLGAEISPDLKPYREPIKGSLGWVGDYASKIMPKSLTSGGWGVLAAVGASGTVVQPTGTEKIQAADKEWDTYVIGWSRGEVSKIWIQDGFPLPIKAKVYSFLTQKPIPIQYEFQLLETKISDTPPECIKSIGEVPTPPLHTTTTTTKFKVDLYWEPAEIKPGEPTKFGVVIFDQKGVPVGSINYKLKVVDAKGNVVVDGQFLAQDGQGIHDLTIEEPGHLSVNVIVLGSSEEFAGGSGQTQFREEANFELVVVPEFPLGLAIVMASIVGIMVAMTRFKKLNIPRL